MPYYRVPEELLKLGPGIPVWGAFVIAAEDADYLWDSENGSCRKFNRFELDFSEEDKGDIEEEA